MFNDNKNNRRPAHVKKDTSGEIKKQEAAERKQREQQRKSRAAEEKKQAELDKKNRSVSDKAAAKEQKAAARAEKRAARPKRDNKKLRLAIIIVSVVLALAVAGAAVGGYYVTKSDVNLPRIYVDNIFVGGMTKAETKAALEEGGWDEATNLALRVKLPAGVSFKLDMCDSGAMLTTDKAVDAAYSYGHAGNWIENLFAFISNYISPVNVSEKSIQIDGQYVRERAQKGLEKLAVKTADNGNEIDAKKEVLRMVKGAGKIDINIDSLCAEITRALSARETLLEYGNIEGSLEMPDFDALYKELSIEPKDAYFEDNFEVVDEVVGCTFDIAQAKALWEAAAPAETIEIPLDIDYPEKTGELLRSMLYGDKLGSQTTYYNGSTENRINNIKLAVSKINEYIMMPGDVFSYNDVVGERTAEAGFLTAGAYNDGEVVQELGGGICQVSSTLYCATLFANLETVDRTSHYFKVNYLDWGLDATVSWGGPEYKFRNDREYPVKIVAYCEDDSNALTIEIWGTDVDESYVELSHGRWYFTHEVYTDVIVGYNVLLTRTIYDKDGNIIATKDEPYGTYHLHKEDIHLPEENPEPDYGGVSDGAVIVDG